MALMNKLERLSQASISLDFKNNVLGQSYAIFLLHY